MSLKLRLRLDIFPSFFWKRLPRYFCTLGACAPELWSDLEILPRMVRAAGAAQNAAEAEAGEELRRHADALWEIALRTLHHCLQYEEQKLGGLGEERHEGGGGI